MNQAGNTSKALAPVAVYTYTRYHHLINTLEALRKNHLASQSVIYVVSDGASQPEHERAVGQIRDYVDNLTGFRRLSVSIASLIMGCAGVFRKLKK